MKWEVENFEQRRNVFNYFLEFELSFFTKGKIQFLLNTWRQLYVLIMSRTRFKVNLPHYNCLNVKELLAQNRGDICNLSDSNGIQTRNHIVRKQKLWLNGWVFVYELSDCWFERCCCHLNFRYRACFEQGVPWYSGNYRV